MAVGISTLTATSASAVQVRVQRWLEVRQLAGTVFYQKGQRTQPARIGTRLQTVGDTIRTSGRSSAVLAIDTGIGFINVSQNTAVRIHQLQKSRDGGRIARLQIIDGQARLQVRRFTHPSSRLEIQTPAGISGVRGTQFGVSVDPAGKTGLATLEGRIFAQAQGQSVDIKGGFQSFVIPGEPPSPPVPLQDNTHLNVERLTAEDRSTIRLSGQVDPVNLLVIANQNQAVDRNGRFDIQVPLSANRRIVAIVTTPLGKQQVYELVVP